jgi:hypothetical protein
MQESDSCMEARDGGLSGYSLACYMVSKTHFGSFRVDFQVLFEHLDLSNAVRGELEAMGQSMFQTHGEGGHLLAIRREIP